MEVEGAEIVFAGASVGFAGPPLFVVKPAEIALAILRSIEVANGNVEPDRGITFRRIVKPAGGHFKTAIEADGPLADGPFPAIDPAVDGRRRTGVGVQDRPPRRFARRREQSHGRQQDKPEEPLPETIAAFQGHWPTT